jgi:hypothetical protein
LQKLTSPAEIGEPFKVITFGKKPVLSLVEGMASPLCRFARGDLTRSL